MAPIPKPILTLLLVGVLVGMFFILQSQRGGTEAPSSNTLRPPLENYDQRPKLLTFGLYVTPDPAQNPIDPPERFTGYHTALDLEILPDERDRDVPVFAACSGAVVYRGTVEGYGGVIVQRCRLEGQDVTVLYGHVDPKSFAAQVNEQVETGKQIAILGDNKTEETGDTRKHLHFQVHKGRAVEFKGYASSQQELESYLDPFPIITQ